jgi:hypothetical protein
MSAQLIEFTTRPVAEFTGAVDGERTILSLYRSVDFGSHFAVVNPEGETVALAACRGIGAPVVISVCRDFNVPYAPVIYGVRQFWSNIGYNLTRKDG